MSTENVWYIAANAKCVKSVGVCIIYIIGVSGSGKTTIGRKLSERLNIPFFDGDDFHSDTNKEKMRSGHPLTDNDRKGWLATLNKLAKEQEKKQGAIIACSALKEKYREVLSSGIRVALHWVYLEGSYELIKARMERRKGHYFGAALLSSQFEALEIPRNVITEDISKAPGEIVERIIREIGKRSSRSST